MPAVLAANIIGQLFVLLITGKLPLRPSVETTMRGIDFYPKKAFMRVLIYAARQFKNVHGYVPDLTSPTTFNEHVFARKFLAPLPMPSLADKLAAKDYVKALLGDEFLPTVVWIGDSVDEFLAANIPPGRYVLKANHGALWNVFLNLPSRTFRSTM